jgi:hypothetical protein
MAFDAMARPSPMSTRRRSAYRRNFGEIWTDEFEAAIIFDLVTLLVIPGQRLASGQTVQTDDKPIRQSAI